MDVYVYYRAHRRHAGAVQARATAMQAYLSGHYGIHVALKRRPEENSAQQHTWMEVYLAVPDGFDGVLEQLVRQADLATLIDGERHTEHFLDFSPCA